MKKQYIEDLYTGQKFASGCHVVKELELKKFAAEFDPQPHHLDSQTAHMTIFEGLVASGWHTAAISSRLLIESEFQPAGGIVGLSVDELRWQKPVQPGDTLHVETEILELRPSKSRRGHGVIKARIITINQKNEKVQSYILHLLALRRDEDTGMSTCQG